MLEQFARDHADKLDIIGVGAQDDLALAQQFVQATGVDSIDMYWDPSFASWQHFGVRANSEMRVLDADGVSLGDNLYLMNQDNADRVLSLIGAG